MIGGTGSGKTSLVNLIPRFYDATSGTVEVFGVPVKDYPAGDLRARIGIVPQRAQLFSGTIRSNLLYGNPDADDAALWEALQVAQAAEFVKAKPMQLDEPVELPVKFPLLLAQGTEGIAVGMSTNILTHYYLL